MNALDQPAVLLPLVGATVLFLLDLAYSVVLVAVSALSRVALHRLRGEAGQRGAFLESLREPQSTYRTATVMARQICLVGAALLLATAARAAGLARPEIAGIVLAAVIGVLAFEMLVARTFALWEPKIALRAVSFLVPPARALLYPFVRPLEVLLERVSRGQVVTEEEREEDQEEEVEAFIEVGEREGILEANEGEMMRSIVDLDETRVREIMTPRTDIVALPLDTTVAEARQAILAAGHSRMPVYRETIDNVIGILHERDLLRAWEQDQAGQSISRYLREVMFVPEPLSAAQLLSEMRLKTQMALVVDEYGGVAGLVTLEDLLEEIVGDIRDEHDSEEVVARQEADGSWLINAAAHVDELEELFGVEFEERDFDTVGGLVVSRCGRVPSEGETLDVDGLHIEVLEGDRRRIRLVRVSRRAASGEAQVGR